MEVQILRKDGAQVSNTIHASHLLAITVINDRSQQRSSLKVTMPTITLKINNKIRRDAITTYMENQSNAANYAAVDTAVAIIVFILFDWKMLSISITQVKIRYTCTEV